MTMLLVASWAIPAFALPINDVMSDSYFYTYFEEAVEAPVAYKPTRTIGFAELGLSDIFEPVDLFAQGEYLYVVNRAGNSVLVLDEQYQRVSLIKDLSAPEGGNIPDLNDKIIGENGQAVKDSEMATASKYQLNSPSGIYVTEEGDIYIADTNNRRVVVCDINGVVKKVVQAVRVPVLGANYIFKPLKIVVDISGGMQIIAYAVNRGIMELDDEGIFRAFVGAPPVSVNMIDWFWRVLSTDEQKKRLVKYVPTEYNNIMTDERGFIYATISTIDPMDLMAAINYNSVSGSVAPVKKLNSAGADTLRRQGEYPPVGDLYFDYDNSPQIIDVAVAEGGRYTILDSRTGRFFTYDSDGNLLYIGGGSGAQFGRLKSPYSIAIRGDEIIISDINIKSLTIYETTDYAKTINKAVEAHASGKYDQAETYWQDVISYNSNMYIAYIGLGKSELRNAMALYDDSRFEHYENALGYFEIANERTNYSKAFKELQRNELTKNFTVIAISFIVLVLGLFSLYIFFKVKKKKKERGAK